MSPATAYRDYLVTAGGLSFSSLDVGRAYLIEGTVLPCPADLNGNGWVGPFDALVLLRSIKRGDAEGDLNGDGVTDTTDFDVLLRDFGLCPAGRPLN